VSDNQLAGLVLALATLAVVTFLAARDLARTPPTRVADSVVAQVPNSPPASPVQADPAPQRRLLFPLRGQDRALLRDNFDEGRGKRRHEALDIMAPRGTEVVAVDDGRVAKIFRSAAGGLSVYQFDAEERYAYYYAHLDGYAPGLAEGMPLKRGDLLGYVGTTGNAPKHAPHLHFAAFELGNERRWWKGKAVNPYTWFR
jgi:murein DD-endopeptidase MepM/ murein hydrolase activator NlpD